MPADARERDQRYMGAALRLARRNLGQTWPNPAVGALVVSRDGMILGAGATARSGRPHAERRALAQAGEGARGATCYVTLEPCAHHGRTPPCVDALVEAGVARVVIAQKDPDARVAGKGIAILRDAGVEVECGVCHERAALLNAGHVLRVTQQRPFVTLKMAVSAEGAHGDASGRPVAITGEETRAHVHMMRARHDAILVGRKTAQADNPLLTCRLPGMEDRSPVRVVLDSAFSLSPRLSMFAEGPPVWIVGRDGGEAGLRARREALGAAGARVIALEGEGRPRVAAVLAALAQAGITRLMVEGGGEVAQSFLDAGLVDEIVIARSPRTMAQITGHDMPATSLALIATLALEGRCGAYERVEQFGVGRDTITTWRSGTLVQALARAAR